MRVFSEYTEANATWLIPLDSILLEIVPFIIGFSFSVWTKVKRPSLSDCASWRHFNFPPPNGTAHHLKAGKGSAKKVRKLVTEKPFTSKWKKEM